MYFANNSNKTGQKRARIAWEYWLLTEAAATKREGYLNSLSFCQIWALIGCWVFFFLLKMIYYQKACSLSLLGQFSNEALSFIGLLGPK